MSILLYTSKMKTKIALISFCFFSLWFNLNSQSFAHADEKENIRLLYGVGAHAIELASVHSALSLEAVLLASRLNGGQQLVTTGTLTQFAPNWQSFRYDPSPQDRLKIQLMDGKTFQYKIQNLLGDLQFGSGNFLSRDHSFTVDILQEEESSLISLTSLQPLRPLRSLQLFSQQYMGQRRGTMVGEVIYLNQFFSLNLELKGNYQFENDSTGSEYKTEYLLTGTVQTPQINIHVDESWYHHMITARNDSTSNVRRTVKSGMTMADGNRYQFHQATLRKAFRNGRPSEPDFWLGQGSLSKNDQVLGNLQLGYMPQRAYFYISLPGEDKIELESWTLPGQ